MKIIKVITKSRIDSHSKKTYIGREHTEIINFVNIDTSKMRVQKNSQYIFFYRRESFPSKQFKKSRICLIPLFHTGQESRKSLQIEEHNQDQSVTPGL